METTTALVHLLIPPILILVVLFASARTSLATRRASSFDWEGSSAFDTSGAGSSFLSLIRA
ncbi:MAG: hypothetical protein IT331_05385 [Anaerolineae bacterium]|nr:hypothetical protein [Anaerolineae bacterium]